MVREGESSQSLSESITVKTVNNAISDALVGTLIDPNTPLYRSLSTESAGMPVRFSSNFLADDIDCVKEFSITLSGSMRNPEFIFEFAEIVPAATPSASPQPLTHRPGATAPEPGCDRLAITRRGNVMAKCTARWVMSA